MIDIAFMWGELPASILAVTPIPFPNSLCRELRPALWHLVVTGQYQNRRHPNETADRSDRTIFFPNGKPDPIVPPDGAHVACAEHVERSSIAICHHAKGLRGRLHIDCLPISVKTRTIALFKTSFIASSDFVFWQKTVEQLPQKRHFVQ